MAGATFDTHKFILKLKKSGFDDRQAEALTDAMQEAKAGTDIVTKADLREYESAIRNDLEKLETGLRHEIDVKHEALRHEISDLRKDMDAKLEKLSLRLVIWLGSIVFLVVNTGPILPKLLHVS